MPDIDVPLLQKRDNGNRFMSPPPLRSVTQKVQSEQQTEQQRKELDVKVNALRKWVNTVIQQEFRNKIEKWQSALDSTKQIEEALQLAHTLKQVKPVRPKFFFFLVRKGLVRVATIYFFLLAFLFFFRLIFVSYFFFRKGHRQIEKFFAAN